MRKQLSGIGQAFRLVWDADKLYPLLLLTQALTASVGPLYVSACVSRLISALAGERRIKSLVMRRISFFIRLQIKQKSFLHIVKKLLKPL